MLDILSDSHFTLAAASANIAGSTQTGADIAKQFAEDFWSNIFKMGIFGRVAQASLLIAGAGVIYKGYYLVREIGKNVLDTEKVIGSLMSIILVLLMLTNSGQISMYTVLGLRNYSNNVSDTILNGIASDFQKLQTTRSFGDSVMAQPHFIAFQKQLDTCAAKADPDCFRVAISILRGKLQSDNITDPAILNKVIEIQADANAAALKAAGGDVNANKSFVEKTGDSISLLTNPGNLAQHLIEILLTGLAIAFYIAIELTLLVFGFTFPINVALSLFDPAPLKSWFGNFWTLVNAKLCFSIVVGIIVYLQLWAETKDGGIGIFVIELLMAIFAPVLTFFYCQGSALALAGAMNSMASAPVRGAMGAGMKALGQFGGGMAKGAGIGAKGAGKRTGAALARQFKR
jgi:ABC-type multidrug transport system fused ATPase/permease subunit